MSNTFRPMGVAAAVAVASAGFAGATSAQNGQTQNLGDLGIVPYYTTNAGKVTGVHIINTTDATQVVKLRLRRSTDSLDALDFNLIMSPKDEWVGSVRSDEAGVFVETGDATCTAPAFNEAPNRFRMPDTFSEGAEEGYIEVIGMAQAADGAKINIGAKHVDGVPVSCSNVRANFFRVDAEDYFATPGNTAPFVKGVHDAATTSDGTATASQVSTYVDTPADALSVSYFVRDSAGGLEFGGNATMVQGFNSVPMMTNQEALLTVDGVPQADPFNFELPNLDGGPIGTNGMVVIDPNGAMETARPGGLTGRYDAKIRPELGAAAIYNDWSNNQSTNFSVNTDWVVTIPGQYLMLDPIKYLTALSTETPALCNATNCDARDIPVRANIKFYDREETAFSPEDGDLVVSPASSVSNGTDLKNEVNVIEWSDTSVLKSNVAQVFDVEIAGAANGWAELTIESNRAKNQAVWASDPNGQLGGSFNAVVNDAPPVIGFAVWERNFGSNAAANYGRAVDHSYGS